LRRQLRRPPPHRAVLFFFAGASKSKNSLKKTRISAGSRIKDPECRFDTV
jgi:hypothetical protein